MNGIYFSGNGNTKHISEMFAKLTGGTATSIESEEALSVIKNEEEFFLAYPIHYSNIPKIVKDFILQNGKLFNGKKIFIIVTMGLFSGDGAGVGARPLKKQGAKIIGGLHLRMPDAIGDVKMLKKTKSENINIIKTTEEKLAVIAADIQNGKYPKDGFFIWNRLAGLFGQRLWFLATVKRLKTSLKIHAEKCIGCGKCASGCPTKSIYVENGKAVFKAGKCTICYRCVNSCPERAITLIGKEVLEQCCFENYRSE